MNENTNATQDISSIAIEDDGQILVGGNFTTIGGASLNRIARLNPDGSVDSSFTIGDGANSQLHAIAVKPLGQIWIGGAFSQYRGDPANRIALLNGDPLDLAITTNPAPQAVDPGTTATFTVATASTGPVSYQWQRNGIDLTDGGDISGATTDTLSIANAEDPDEDSYRVIVTHDTTLETKTSEAVDLIVLGAPEILAQPESVTTEAGLTASFSVSARGASPVSYQWYLGSVALTDDSDISGATTAELTLSNLEVADSGTLIVRVTNHLGFADSAPATLTVEKFPHGIAREIKLPLTVNSTINDVLPLDDGSYVIGGNFSSVTYNGGSASRRYLAKFHPDGTLDTTFPQISGSGSVNALALADDGKIYVGGNFTTINFNGSFISSPRIVRINPDGTHDSTFSVGTGPNNTVLAIRAIAGGKSYLSGYFASINGDSTAKYVARLNSDGSIDSSFVSQASASIEDISLVGDGSLWLAHPNSWSGQSRIVRVDSTGTPVTGFSYTGSMNSYDVVATPDGGALSFSWSWPYQQKISPTGAIDTSWATAGSANNRIYEAEALADGRAFIGGTFSSYAGTTRSGIAVIESDGSLNNDFNPGSAFNGAYPQKFRTDAHGRIWCAGNMNIYRGETISGLVVLNGFDTTPADPFIDYLTEAGVPEGQQTADGDFDNDGWANLLEFLYGSDPADSAGGLGTTWNPVNSNSNGATINSIDPAAGLDPAKTYRTVQVRVPADKQGITVALEAGLDLTDFGTGSAQSHPLGTPVADGPDHEIQTYYLTPAIDDAPSLFWRLRVSR